MTLQDSDIIKHYQQKSKVWDGSFVIWIGPPSSPPPEASNEDAMIMAWPQEYGKDVPWPGILYRQVAKIQPSVYRPVACRLDER